MQGLCKEKIPWSCFKFHFGDVERVELLKSIDIHRYLKIQSISNSHTELHGFCDGLGKADAAVIYTSHDEISMSFSASKNKRNPLKHLTLLRIEFALPFYYLLCSTILEIMPISLEKSIFVVGFSLR
ncbi:hypothetical protein TNCT_695871 [Trichonephila clavata]|uniref:Uncharacterized protein n=1 Tax=Trichonephila clavata TaxID=2740835 RepID=A0A8X6J6X7_TRICU|nr:hypothetical protein TNCT_695871 [Trichonephila clavata]